MARSPVDPEASRTSSVVEFTYGRSRKDRHSIRIEAVHPSDHIFRMIRGNGTFYELDLLEHLRTLFSWEERPVVIDVGANIGNHAVFFAKYVASHVVAIEPNPVVLPVLERNLRNNPGDGSWSILATALGAEEGVGVMELPAGAEENLGMARVRQKGTEDIPGESVTVTTLDRVVADLYDSGRLDAPVQLIKIDVEGMETDVLRGASRTIERFAPDIVVEAKDDSEKSRLDALLEPLGYVAVSSHGATPTHHYMKKTSRRRFAARLSGFYRSLQVKGRWLYHTLRGK